MNPSRLLIANRGEIAIRIARAAAELGIRTVGVHAADDADCLHTRHVDELRPLDGTGASAYLDQERLITIAIDSRCDAIHPGYGFLSENAGFAERCREAGISFVGPRAEVLKLFGDKIAARRQAEDAGVPVLAATNAAASVDEARAFFERLAGSPMIVKAVAGGGGRGMRIVESLDGFEDAFARCSSEARAAFGDGSLYVERLVPRARHIEVQIVGDSQGAVVHLGERDCSVQRRHQKLIEIAPSPGLPEPLRQKIHEAALRLARAVRYDNIGTLEFIVDAESLDGNSDFAFIEANPRLQVEHTVTEEVTGVDLVRAQIELAGGASLESLGIQRETAELRGVAIQLRINMETMTAEGKVVPSGGVLTAFDPPTGPGIRVDSFGYSGYRTSPQYDSLLAKLIVRTSGEFADALTRAKRALSEFRIEGVSTNLPLLQSVLEHPNVERGDLYTRLIDENAPTLTASTERRARYVQSGAERAAPPRAGAKIDAVDPLAVISYGKSGNEAATAPTTPNVSAVDYDIRGPEGTTPVCTPMLATVVSIDVAEGDVVHRGQEILVLNAMKMEHGVEAEISGVVRQIVASPGDTIPEGVPLLFIEEQEIESVAGEEEQSLDLDALRPDLAEVVRRHDLTSDAARPDAAKRRHEKGERTARENIEDLCDPGTFVPYGSLVVGQGLEGTVDELLGYSPGDGMVMGLGHVNGDLFDETRSRCIAMSYDYTVLAGTQGGQNHRMKDRIFNVAHKLRLPIVFFTEGGGGRAGGGSRSSGARGRGGAITGGGGLGVPSFTLLAGLSGLVPLIGINSGRCFAGNAALLGCCDVIIAAANSSIGMGGPAMIEGGGLGVFRPEEVGPLSVQVPNGVVDIAVADEAEAVRMAKQYLSYFQGPLSEWECADQRVLRHAIPENRLRIYDIRALIETLADTDSVLELRPEFGRAMITAFVRIEGRPVGVVANNPAHLSGAIDSPAADKAARFMQLCDAFDIPLLFLCDTPGIMVGPEVETTGIVRHCTRMFVVGASITVPTFTVVLRKAYGLGAQTMGGGNHKLPIFTVSWPTGEFGGMGLEGQVKLGLKRFLEETDDPKERQALYERFVAQAYERGKAVNAAHVFEVDDVIDPADTRRWISAGLRAAPPPEPRTGKKRPCVDTW